MASSPYNHNADHTIVQVVEDAGRLGASSVGAASRLSKESEDAEVSAVQAKIKHLIDSRYRRLQSRGVLERFGGKVKVKVKGLFREKKEEAEKTEKKKAEERKAKQKEKREKFREEIKGEYCKPKLPQCYEEIVRLIDIEKSPIYARALEEWTRKEKLLTNRVERKKKKVSHLKNEIYQLIGFFSVFQGVLLTAVAQSSLLHCNNRWSPIILSVVASVVTIAGVFQKLMQIRDLQKTIHNEEEALKEVTKRSSNLRTTGVENFKFGKFYEDDEKTKQSKRRHRIYFFLVIVSLAIFALGFPLSHWRILCDPGRNPYPR